MVHHEIDHLDGVLFIDRIKSVNDFDTIRENERGEMVRVPYANIFSEHKNSGKTALSLAETGMRNSLDGISRILRQTMDAARLVSIDPAVHEKLLRDALGWAKEYDLNQSPPVMTQCLHRHLREGSGVDDPEIKDQQNFMALKMINSLRSIIESSSDPLLLAPRLSIAGNVIDMGEMETSQKLILFRQLTKL